ncbi:MAG: polymer-forming cytoskeletal protein [Spirochaetaceae bacterium]|nr:MAG: polymer-forming cytoskeletal protein [Spirochaetaceae bacterium]
MELGSEVNSTIGESSQFEGRFAVNGNLRIDGKFEGSCLYVDQLEIGPRARVKTKITATSVIVKGIVIGNIEASRRVLLFSTARVLGDLKTPELIIQEGVIFEGKCRISPAKITEPKEFIDTLYENSGVQPVQKTAGKKNEKNN